MCSLRSGRYQEDLKIPIYLIMIRLVFPLPFRPGCLAKQLR